VCVCVCVCVCEGERTVYNKILPSDTKTELHLTRASRNSVVCLIHLCRYTHTHTDFHTYTHTRTHTHIHTHTKHTQTHIHIHTPHTHIHTYTHLATLQPYQEPLSSSFACSTRLTQSVSTACSEPLFCISSGSYNFCRPHAAACPSLAAAAAAISCRCGTASAAAAASGGCSLDSDAATAGGAATASGAAPCPLPIPGSATVGSGSCVVAGAVAEDGDVVVWDVLEGGKEVRGGCLFARHLLHSCF